MELVGDFALPLPLTIIADMMGIPPQDRSRFNSWSKGVMALTSGTVLGTLRALPGMWLLIRYFRKLIARRRADPRDDFVTALVQAEEGVTGLMKTNSSPCSSCSSGISWSRSCLAGALWRPPFSSKSVSASEMSSRV